MGRQESPPDLPMQSWPERRLHRDARLCFSRRDEVCGVIRRVLLGAGSINDMDANEISVLATLRNVGRQKNCVHLR